MRDLPSQDDVIVTKKGRVYSDNGERNLKLKCENTVIKFFVLNSLFYFISFILMLFECSCM